MNQPKTKNLFPNSVVQNPSLINGNSQNDKNAVQNQTAAVLNAFFKLLPSNYVSRVDGPFYVTDFLAIAEQIAKIQINAQEAFTDSFYDFTRPEVIHQILGSLVFPDAATRGVPSIDGDLSYRTFLQRMAILILRGATNDVIKSGVQLLTDAVVTVSDRGKEKLMAGDDSAWPVLDQHVFDIFTDNDGKFATDDPALFEKNLRLVMDVLKPAHTLYQHRHLFVDTFSVVLSDTVTQTRYENYYHDTRLYQRGLRCISGSAGTTHANRFLFSDPTRDFFNIRPGSVLTILAGPNSTGNYKPVSDDRVDFFGGRYQVEEVIGFTTADDSTPRRYEIGDYYGFLTVSGGDTIFDPDQNFGEFLPFQSFSILDGPNVGTYLLKDILGTNGGRLGSGVLSGTSARIGKSTLRLRTPMKQEATDQSYEVEVDKRGNKSPISTTENVSAFFFR